MFCDGYVDTFVSVLKTALLFLGGMGSDPDAGLIHGSHVPEYMVKANLAFINQTMGIVMDERPVDFIDINPDDIQSGDLFVISRLDGLSPIVMYGTGSHATHCTMALRIDGELYIIESQNAWYWPIPNI